MKKSIVNRLIIVVITAVIGMFVNWLAMPALTLRSSELYWFAELLVVIVMIGSFIVNLFSDEYEDKDIVGRIAMFIAVGIFVLILIIGILSGVVLNTDKYQQLADVSDGDISTDVPEFGIDDISIVDVDTAEKLGDRTIANLSNASWYEVDSEYNLIVYQGKQYRISAINYGDFFKFQKAKKMGIPGYVLVDCETQEATLVEVDEAILYSPSAHFKYRLKRVLRSQFPTLQFGTSFFEIDEAGNPYWITAVRTPSIGVWGGKVEKGCIITDATNGTSTLYEISDTPEWVDHVCDCEYLFKVANYHFAYTNGFWNTLFSKTGVYMTTYSFSSADFEGYTSCVNKEGEVVFFTGITPANNAESNVGFIFANSRTGEIKYYDCYGAEESSAQAAANSLVQNYGYNANFPVVVNVNGTLTYFMMLKDSAGLTQRYSLCNVENYSIVVESQKIEDALIMYQEELGIEEEGNVDPSKEMMTVTGLIQRIYTAEIDGNTIFFYTFVNDANLYMSSIENANRQVTLKPGDEVTLMYTDSQEDGVYLVNSILF